MRRRHRWSGLLLSAGVMTMVFAASAMAQEAGPGVKKTAKYESGIQIDRLKAAQDTDQVIVIVGTGMDSAKIQATYFKKAEDGIWKEEFSVPGYCGYNGMADEKREGDRRTPTGIYSFDKAFGIKADPGSILPYKELDQYDYWVDDSSSKYYNQMVSSRTTPVTWKSAEHLIKVNPCYNYSLALNYNADCIPGKGSAIFLHGLHPVKTWTEGCIAIPEENMKDLVRQADGNTRIVVVADASGLEYSETN